MKEDRSAKQQKSPQEIQQLMRISCGDFYIGRCFTPCAARQERRGIPEFGNFRNPEVRSFN